MGGWQGPADDIRIAEAYAARQREYGRDNRLVNQTMLRWEQMMPDRIVHEEQRQDGRFQVIEQRRRWDTMHCLQTSVSMLLPQALAGQGDDYELALDVVLPAFCHRLERDQPPPQVLDHLAGIHSAMPVPMRFLRMMTKEVWRTTSADDRYNILRRLVDSHRQQQN